MQNNEELNKFNNINETRRAQILANQILLFENALTCEHVSNQNRLIARKF